MPLVYVATRNSHKVEEYQMLLRALPVEVRALPEGLPESPEDGHSFEANAMEKAVYYARFCDSYVLADDSGLSVPALGGEPGVLSARYAGTHGDDAANNRKLLGRLSEMQGEQRRAEFVCAIAVWSQAEGRGLVVRAGIPGYIAQEPQGHHGFGYDPLFYLPDFSKTMAQLLPNEKNRVSHRARAVDKLISALAKDIAD